MHGCVWVWVGEHSPSPQLISQQMGPLHGMGLPSHCGTQKDSSQQPHLLWNGTVGAAVKARFCCGRAGV